MSPFNCSNIIVLLIAPRHVPGELDRGEHFPAAARAALTATTTTTTLDHLTSLRTRSANMRARWFRCIPAELGSRQTPTTLAPTHDNLLSASVGGRPADVGTG